jgi:GGDEF domain-containing protein
VTTGIRTPPAQVCDPLVPLHDFVVLSANVMEAHTVALFLEDPSLGCLRMAAAWSLSNHLVHGAVVSLADTVLGRKYLGGQPEAELHFEGDSTALGMYSHPEPIRAYMTAPVGSRGLLWTDTRQAYRFTGKHLKIFSDLARTAENLLQVSGHAAAFHEALEAAAVMRRLLAYSREPADRTASLLDAVVRMVVEKMGFDGALTAVRIPNSDLCRISACCGFPPFIQIGRRVRFRQGWVKQALDSRGPKVARARVPGDPDVVAFHAGERFGFPVRSLAVIPWSLEDQGAESVLVVASANPGRMTRKRSEPLESLTELMRLIQVASFRKRLLCGVRRYDAESGVLNEGAFSLESREMLSRARDKGGSLALVLTEISHMGRIYLEHDPATVNRFLEMITDALRVLQPRPCIVGKFKTGGFGLLVENAKEQENHLLFKKAPSLFGTGYMGVGGWEIRYGMAMAVAHFPGDCFDLDGLWSTALDRLAKPSSTLYRWASLGPLSRGNAAELLAQELLGEGPC